MPTFQSNAVVEDDGFARVINGPGRGDAYKFKGLRFLDPSTVVKVKYDPEDQYCTIIEYYDETAAKFVKP